MIYQQLKCEIDLLLGIDAPFLICFHDRVGSSLWALGMDGSTNSLGFSDSNGCEICGDDFLLSKYLPIIGEYHSIPLVLMSKEMFLYCIDCGEVC